MQQKRKQLKSKSGAAQKNERAKRQEPIDSANTQARQAKSKAASDARKKDYAAGEATRAKGAVQEKMKQTDLGALGRAARAKRAKSSTTTSTPASSAGKITSPATKAGGMTGPAKSTTTTTKPKKQKY